MNNGEFNTKENGSNNRGTVICGWCCYDANPVGAKHCQKCGKLLVITSTSKTSDGVSKLSSTSYVGWLALALVLLLFGGGGYYVWQQLQFLTINSSLNSVNKNSSDIQLYDSMKSVPNVPEGIYNYSGSPSFASLAAHGTHKAITKAQPKFHLRYTEPSNNKPGSTTAIAMLLDGEVSFAQTSRTLEDSEYSKARERNFSLQQVAVAIDAVGFYTHPDVNILGLSVAQLQDIYKGKTTNWKDMGGATQPIVLFTLNTYSSGALMKTLLGSKVRSVSPKAQFCRDLTEMFRKVASTPGAIGIGTASQIVGQRTVRPVAVAPGNSKQYVPLVTENGRLNALAFRDNTYPLTRRLFVVIRRDDTPDEAAGIAYANLLLSKEGQQFIEKSGFVPLHAQ